MMNFQKAVSVTANDTNPLAHGTAQALYVGGAGNVALRPDEADADVTFTGVPAGGYIWCNVSHVRLTGTTATALVALYT